MNNDASDLDAIFTGEAVREVLREQFFQAPAPKKPRRSNAEPSDQRAEGEREQSDKGEQSYKGEQSEQSYKVICISLYHEDLEQLDQTVQALKAAGHRRVSRSSLIRYALDTVDLASFAKSRRHL